MPAIRWPNPRMLVVAVAALCCSAVSAVAQDLLYSNAFEGMRDGSRPPGWTLAGLDKPEYWFISQGAFYTGNGDNDRGVDGFAVIADPASAAWANYALSSDFWMTQALGDIYLVARWQNRDNYYLAILSTGTEMASPNYAQIAKVENGQRYVLGEAIHGQRGVTLPRFIQASGAADSRKLSFAAVGSSLTFSMDGTVLVTAQDRTFTRGTAGLGQRENEVFFDNVVVMSAAAPAAAAPAAAPAPPPSQASALPTGAVYRLILLEGVDRATADGIRNELNRSYPGSVDVVTAPNGTNSVLFGVFLSEQEALQRMETLMQEEGFTFQGVARVSGDQALETFHETTSPAARETRFRVVANELGDEARAEDMKRALEESGFFPVEVEPFSGRFRVLCGPPFINQQDAERLANDLRVTGYFTAAVAEVRPELLPPLHPPDTTIAALPPLISTEILQQVEEQRGYQPTEAELQQVQEVLLRREAIRSGGISADAAVFQELREQIDKLTAEQRTIVRMFEDSEQERARREMEARRLKAAVEAAQDAKNYDRALQLLDDWEQLDPGNVAIGVKRSIVERLRAGDGDVSEAMARERQTQAERQIREARQSEQDGHFAHALTLWRQMRTLVPPTSAVYAEATESIQRLSTKIERENLERLEAERQGLNRTFFIIIVGIVVLVALAAAAMIMMMVRSRRRDQELLRQVQELTVRPLRELEESQRPKLLEGDADDVVEGETVAADFSDDAKPAPPPPRQDKPKADDLDSQRIVSPTEEPDEEPAPAKEIKPALAPPPPPAAAKEVAPAAAPAKEPAPVPPPPPEAETAPPEAPSPPEEEKEAAHADMDHLIPTIDIPSQEDLTALLSGASSDAPVSAPPAPALPPPPPPPPPAPVAPAAPAAAAADNGNLIYEQDFDEEEEGAMPRNWTGEYDYSSLRVSAQTPAPGSTRCLRFEKNQGSGSAYYACRFPEITGKVAVEFDLRCDDKNKYLLGFYVEKDEDFRQSVHTIVHRTSPQVAPTLRVQGEPTQYSLGTWRHLRYEIDLPANQVNGYVDGNLVAENVKLASPPKSINTLSIRDNLATTGVLLIDNIKIRQL